MLNRLRLTGASVALDANNIANDIAPTSGVAVTQLITSVGDDLAHKIIVTNNSATDYSGGGKTITIVGTNADGKAVSETIAGPAGSNTSTTTGYFLTFTSITPNFSRGTTDTFDIGYTAASVTPWLYVDLYDWSTRGMWFATIVDTGSPTYGVEQTYDGGVTAFTHATVTGETTSQEGSYSFPVQAVRLIFSAAGTVTMHAYY